MRLVIFDMDGTLISSTAVTERIYTLWAETKGVEVGPLLAMMHGVRTVDVIRKLNRPDLDPEFEAEIIGKAEREELDGVLAIPGAREFLASLPPERWALVTSADRELMRLRMNAAGIPFPNVIVTAEDVTAGKPDPRMLLELMREFGTEPERTLMIGDTTHDLQMALNAGCASVGVSYGAHATDGFEALQPSAVVHSVRELHAWLLENA